MRILSLHCDYIRFKPIKKALRQAKELKEEEKKIKEIKECLVIFTAVEKKDEKNIQIVDKFIKNIKEIVEKVKCRNIVLYPYVHLTSEPALPERAEKILEDIYSLLKKKFSVTKVPFAYYKEFELKCKGHPLAELSREIKAEEETREEITKKIKSRFLILNSKGKEIKINKNKDEILDKIIKAERKSKIGEPLSIRAMKSLNLVRYEPLSDPGNFSFLPKGKLIFDLIKEYIEKSLEDLECIEVETPIMYDWNNGAIREQAKSFHERHYMIKVPDEKRQLVLRFAGDFGIFSILKDSIISYKNLPFRVYEFSKSFRYEQRGELSGLNRLRAFHMPDIHSFTKNIDEGFKEFEKLFCYYDKIAKKFKIEYGIVFRITEDFYKKYKHELIKLLKKIKKPAYLEILSKMKHYWALKSEHNFIDTASSLCQLSTVQLDIKDASTYGINYRDKDGKLKGCIICHSSIGSIERWFYSLLEQSLKQKKPELPFWLSPTQVRIIPISQKFLKQSLVLMRKLEKENIRVDLDDRNLHVEKKILESEQEWIPYVIVFGKKEIESKKIALRERKTGKIFHITLKNSIKKFKKLQGGMPFKKLALPKLLSKRPKF